MRRILVLGLFPAALCAQLVSFGVKGGVPLSTAFDTVRTANVGYLSDTKRYLVGGAFELRFPFGMGMELDALYRRLNYESFQVTAPNASLAMSTVANSWEFPLLFKLRAPSPVLRPYLTAGPSFRHLSGLRQFIAARIGSLPATREEGRPIELSNRFNSGFAIGGGLEFGRRFRLAPEIRYTRWGWENFSAPSLPDLRSNLNQLDFLLGIHF